MNRFLYVEGNPASLIDPTGHVPAPGQLCPWGPEDCSAPGVTYTHPASVTGGGGGLGGTYQNNTCSGYTCTTATTGKRYDPPKPTAPEWALAGDPGMTSGGSAGANGLLEYEILGAMWRNATPAERSTMLAEMFGSDRGFYPDGDNPPLDFVCAGANASQHPDCGVVSLGRTARTFTELLMVGIALKAVASRAAGWLTDAVSSLRGRSTAPVTAGGTDPAVVVAGVDAGAATGADALPAVVPQFGSRYWANVHFWKHVKGWIYKNGTWTRNPDGVDMPEFDDVAAYADAASRFMSSTNPAILNGFQRGNPANGLMRFDQQTGWFAIYRDGAIRTFFRPRDGVQYFYERLVP
jgi:hypothetical protein